MRSRRKWIVAGAALGVPLLLAALAWWWWVPAAVRSRAEDAATRRLGSDVRIGDASLRLHGVVLEEVRLVGRHGGLLMELDEIGVRGGLFALAFGGSSAVEAIQVRGGRVEVALHEGGLESLAAVRAAAGGEREGEGENDAPSSAEGFGSGRAIQVLDLEAIVVDEAGPLLRVSGGEVSGGEGEIRLGADELEVGGGAGHRIALGGAEARLGASAEDLGWQLSSASAAGAQVVWARRPGPEGEDGDPAGQPRLLARFRALAAAVRGEPEDQGDEPPADRPAWLRRLAPDATLRLANATVRARTDEGEETILTELRTVVEHRGEGRLHLEGAGTPASGGALGWDLELEPLVLRAEGTISFEDLPLALVAPLLPEVPWHEPEHGRLDGELRVAGDATEPLAIRGRLSVRDAALHSPRIAPEPVGGIAFTVEGEGRWLPQDRRLEIASGTVTMGGAAVQLAGALEWAPEHYLVDITATLPSTDCGTAIAAIPRDLLADLAGFSWSGQVGARLVAKVDSRSLEETDLDIDVFDACQFETVPSLADLRRVQAPFLHRVREPGGTWFEMTTGPGSGNWTSIYAVSPFLIHAVLAHEDAGFFRHGGFAPWAIRDALERNLREGRYVVGASTITMQLAKNLFLHREKTLARKVQEVILTWWLESALEKPSILELYLNVIEYGPSVYGIRNAALHYFGRDPSELSPAESAFLANILPNPKLYHHQYERGQLSNSMRNRIERLLRHMNARGRIDEAALEFGVAELANFSFHREGAPPPPAREVAGTAGELPFRTGAPDWDTAWEEWDEEAFDDPAAPEDELPLLP